MADYINRKIIYVTYKPIFCNQIVCYKKNKTYSFNKTLEMVRVNEKNSKSSCHSTQSESKCPKSVKKYKNQSALHCRNPFLIFLQQFRNKERTQRYNMSAFESSAVAGHLWQRMTDAEKTPYIRIAHKYNYVFKSRNRKVNWVLRKLRQVLADGKLELHFMMQLASKMASWNERIMSNVFGLDDDSSDDCEDDE
ncbi:HMG1/2-like protein [Drosophila innubila]|uniref:HMG1/2-like protein n=1 Tax=Drosophila innubila TaxID=198719 RepID=UPI00148C7A6A|nr:HMG1/2-like protein [Drosophila innubila]